MRLDDEHALIESATKNSEAFGILFERHYPAIFGYVLRRVGNWEAWKFLS